MFNFDEEKLTDEQIMNIAIQDGLPPLLVAINANGYRQTQGFWGHPDASEVYKDEALGVLINIIRKMAKNGKGVLGIRSLYEGARRAKRIKGGNDRLMARIKDEFIPALESMNLACLIGDKIYVHPAILEESWEPNFKVYE
ncbi:hypothetical protein OAJGMMKP_00058 [Escherichia phage vB_EcoS-12397IV]|uniref:Uncharacterized protein n=34 Tax=Veterinaerplatzvirus vv12210I TaxID=2844167 RepID=A0A5P1M2W1_9CAUD|nr:hypothetical protein H1N77_gp55 [Escherichia phage vB_EcoS-12210I]QDJ98030.1 hypothetical protein EPENGAHN_00062 [Escherichia phage vB_EcoS-12210III]QDJ98071.1 hypothetical protein LNEMGHCG_00039 [Escherichia phage vB_EcoS-12397I]QDJ98119.1 hypothetical protein AKDFDEBO_00021 [Escherichia phage vB_EcoS-12397II]QDJ98171.1 hypothetical protein BFFAFCJP_00007 [Escherichia phage vB_EcoS-12397III]QDJ98287.1 hypothetical protein OAJGMMKP_00058 [Escherichia phage vB_EcoS-12397IV]QDJ98347.1 hypoth